MSTPESGDLFSVPKTERKIYTVTALTREIKRLLEDNFAAVWVTGEISNARQYSSGHIYLTIKDENAQLQAVIWRTVAAKMRFRLEDGLEVIAFGDIDVYEPRGSYQLIISRLEPRGVGALQLAFEQLKKNLAAEGLFDADRKRPIPAFPTRIGIVTSPDGAAIRDILNIIGRRFPNVHLLLRPARVQGEGAAEEIAQGIQDLNRVGDVDVIIVGRGGGSLEDLWAFNEEVVARAIAASDVPVISAVGHEIDFTIADFAADMRAATPSEAAELVVPVLDDVLQSLSDRAARMAAALRSVVSDARQKLQNIEQSYAMRHPADRLMQLHQRTDELSQRLGTAARHMFEMTRQKLAGVAAHLESLNPAGILERGYSITTKADGTIVHSPDDVEVGDVIRSRLHKGELYSTVRRPPREDQS